MTCPVCGGTLYVEDAERLSVYVAGGFHVIGDPLPRRVIAVRVRACAACEFVEDIQRGTHHGVDYVARD